MIITLTEKNYIRKEVKKKISERKVFKPTFLGLWGKYEIEDVISTYWTPDYSKFTTKKIHINSNNLYELIETEHHTAIKKSINNTQWDNNWTFLYVCETIDEIKNKLK